MLSFEGWPDTQLYHPDGWTVLEETHPEAVTLALPRNVTWTDVAQPM